MKTKTFLERFPLTRLLISFFHLYCFFFSHFIYFSFFRTVYITFPLFILRSLFLFYHVPLFLIYCTVNFPISLRFLILSLCLLCRSLSHNASYYLSRRIDMSLYLARLGSLNITNEFNPHWVHSTKFYINPTKIDIS